MGTEQRNTRDEEDNFNITKELGSNVLGRHVVELMVESSHSEFMPCVLGALCIQTDVSLYTVISLIFLALIFVDLIKSHFRGYINMWPMILSIHYLI